MTRRGPDTGLTCTACVQSAPFPRSQPEPERGVTRSHPSGCVRPSPATKQVLIGHGRLPDVVPGSLEGVWAEASSQTLKGSAALGEEAFVPLLTFDP